MTEPRRQRKLAGAREGIVSVPVVAAAEIRAGRRGRGKESRRTGRGEAQRQVVRTPLRRFRGRERRLVSMASEWAWECHCVR